MSDNKPAKRRVGGPAKGLRPPFEKGNPSRMTHGAQSDRLVEPRARDELMPIVLEANPHLDASRDGPAVFRYCVNLARVERTYRWLGEQDDEVFADLGAGEVHAVYGRLQDWERAADRAEERLAISPGARAKLGLQRARGEELFEHLRRTYSEGEK